MYILQRPDLETDIEESPSALTDLVHASKIRAFGTSMLPASDIVRAQWVSERRRLERLPAEQLAYSILNRSVEREVLTAAKEFGMGALA